MPNLYEKCTTIEEVVGQAVGAGSICWNPRPSTQVFDSELASSIVNDAVARIRELDPCSD